jgi:hypothetical protein
MMCNTQRGVCDGAEAPLAVAAAAAARQAPAAAVAAAPLLQGRPPRRARPGAGPQRARRAQPRLRPVCQPLCEQLICATTIVFPAPLVCQSMPDLPHIVSTRVPTRCSCSVLCTLCELNHRSLPRRRDDRSRDARSRDERRPADRDRDRRRRSPSPRRRPSSPRRRCTPSNDVMVEATPQAACLLHSVTQSSTPAGLPNACTVTAAHRAPV